MKKLDLHGTRHEFVKSALIRFIEDAWDKEGPKEDAEIITGYSDKMKEIVKEVLDEYKLEYVEGDAINKGYIKTFI